MAFLALTSSPTSQMSMVDRFNANSAAIYNNPSIYDSSNPDTSGDGIRQPFVWTSPDDSNFNKFLTKYDTTAAPFGSVIRDEERIGKFLGTSKGIFFLAQQALMQGQNPFNETSLYNPLSIPLTIASQASLGLFSAPTRFINLSEFSAPAGTLAAAVPSSNQSEGAGLQRARTAAAAYTNFSNKYATNDPWSSQPSFLSQLASTIAPNLAPLPTQIGTFKVGDTVIYNTMLSDLTNQSSVFSYLDNNGTQINAKQSYSTPSTYSDAISSAADNSLLESVWQNWSSGTSQGNSQISVPNTPNVSTINSSLKSVLSGFSSGTGLPSISGLAGIAASLTGGAGLPGINSIGGVVGGLQGIGTGQGPVGIKTYSQLMSAANSISPGLSGPASGYLSQFTSLIPSQGLNSGKGFADATSGGDSYNTQGISQDGSLQGNSDAAFQNAANDLIAFYFSDLVNGVFIPFRATLTGIDNPNSSKWSDVHYVGRADRIFVYEGFERDLSFSFKVYANSPEEMAPMWQRINYLVSLTSPANYTSGPNSSGQFIVPPFVKVTIGDLIKNQPVVLQSVGVSVPDEASWELLPSTSQYSYLAGIITRQATVGQVPMFVEISVSAAVLEKIRPQVGNLQFGDLNTGGVWSSALLGSGGSAGSGQTGIPGLPSLSSLSNLV